MQQIISLILWIGGLCMVGLNSSWWVAIGIILMMWANNIQTTNWITIINQRLKR